MGNLLNDEDEDINKMNNRNNNVHHNLNNSNEKKGINKVKSLNPKTMGSISNLNNMNKQSEEMNKKLENESEIENNIRDYLKCYICLTKVIKPKMCKYCKKISCEKCINKWMEKYDFCGICKKKLNPNQDLIPLPILDDMAAYFINNIDSHPKILQNNNSNILNNENKNAQSSNPNNNMNVIEQNNNAQNIDICPIHNYKIEYYCIQCDKYFCSNCLVFFGKEIKKHENHLIIPISKINNLNLKEAFDEYKKLSITNNILDNNIDLCKVKLRENQIKKGEIANFLDLIRDLYIQKIEENSQELNSFLNKLTNQRDQVENKIVSISNGFDNIIKTNDIPLFSEELKKINIIDKSIEYEIKEISKENPQLFVENYETDYLEISLPFSGQYIEGYEVFKKRLNIMPGFPSIILLQYLQYKIVISFSVDISLPLNDPRYPKFNSYITFKNGQDGLEFRNLSNQSFPQDFPVQGSNPRQTRQQVNTDSFDATKFIQLFGNDKKVKMKLFIIKYHYEQ